MFVYLDNSATTRQYDAVTDEMVRIMKEDFGNPSSIHRMGITADLEIKEARKSLASLLGARDEEVFFTGSGTEADNTAVFGAVYRNKRRGNKIITTKIEHPAVLEACKKLEQTGFTVIYIDVDEKGVVDTNSLADSIDESTVLVSVMYINNELGTVEPIKDIGDIIRGKGGTLFHTDAVQALGKIPFDIKALPVDLLSVSAHKIHGPKGVGALYIKKGVHIDPLIFGGGQEGGFRSGTENTPALAGFGMAAQIIKRTEKERFDRMCQVRAYLLKGIKDEISDVCINSPEAVYSEDNTGPVCSPSILNVSFLGCRGEVLLHYLEQQDIYVSTGAACSSKKKNNHVLSAAGLNNERIESAVRFSFSEFNTLDEMDHVLPELKKAVGKMRSIRGRR